MSDYGRITYPRGAKKPGRAHQHHWQMVSPHYFVLIRRYRCLSCQAHREVDA